MKPVSAVQKNIVFNYISQFYVGFIGILILPLYLKYLGAEAYGLIGFFAVLQSWMQLLDFGISPTLGREIARFNGRSTDAPQLRILIRSIEILFAGIALTATLLLFFSRYWLAQNWLNTQDIQLQDVSICFGLLAPTIGSRLLTSLYRSGINGFEQQVWMSIVNVIFVTLRFPASLLLVVWTNGNLIAFFAYQLVLTLMEQLVITLKFYTLLPGVGIKIKFCLAELKRVAPFALGIAYTGAIWVLVTQLDKLLLAKVLPLAEYGYFTLVATIAGGLVLLSGPVSGAVLPRMTALLAENREREMLLLYRRATRFVAGMVAPLTFVLALFPREAVYVWTGNTAAADWAAPILPLFILGSGLLAIGAFQYYLQYAHGRLRHHIIYNTVSVLISVPLITYAAFYHGPLGVAWVWFGFRLFSLLTWTPYIHHLFAPGMHRVWLFEDVLAPAAAGGFVLFVLLEVLGGRFPAERAEGFAILAIATALSIASALLTGFWREIRDGVYAAA